MMKSMYAEILADDEGLARASERLGLTQLVEMLDSAIALGAQSRVTVDALASFNAVWSSLLEDLAQQNNFLPGEVRARLISIGIFLLKEAESIQKGNSENLAVLRDVTATIAEGLA